MEREDINLLVDSSAAIAGMVSAITGIALYLHPTTQGSLSALLKPALVVLGVSLLASAALAVRRRYILPYTLLAVKLEHTEPKYTYRPKVRIIMRNEGRSCLNVRTLRWIPGPKGVPEHPTQPKATWQVFAGGEWLPKEDGLSSAHVKPDEEFKTWISFAGSPSTDEIQRRLDQKLLGTLELLINGRKFRMKL